MEILRPNFIPNYGDYEPPKYGRERLYIRQIDIIDAHKSNDREILLNILDIDFNSLNLLDAIKKLIKNGIDLNCQDKFGNTALIIAMENHYNLTLSDIEDIIDILIENGANIYTRNMFGKNAIILAKELDKENINTSISKQKEREKCYILAHISIKNRYGDFAIIDEYIGEILIRHLMETFNFYN